ncbi:hypothetical protein FN846DRAFT_976555 [Sphaerosporella brunnea]|uniref:Uncharacterized protein n=1 Tax=Sphaerosporella brunnea TaxID=1250544 RepID=A0A5J5EEX6_9PEZI|nr:hypothetical protein FN846DRAFT_976555 [Sphaerosporella brunnea]
MVSSFLPLVEISLGVYFLFIFFFSYFSYHSFRPFFELVYMYFLSSFLPFLSASCGVPVFCCCCCFCSFLFSLMLFADGRRVIYPNR